MDGQVAICSALELVSVCALRDAIPVEKLLYHRVEVSSDLGFRLHPIECDRSSNLDHDRSGSKPTSLTLFEMTQSFKRHRQHCRKGLFDEQADAKPKLSEFTVRGACALWKDDDVVALIERLTCMGEASLKALPAREWKDIEQDRNA